MSQKYYQKFINEKFGYCVYFLTAFHLIIWLMTYPKNFEKISILKIWQLGCWNSLQWEITLICHWNIHSWKQKLFFVYVMVPKNDQNIT